jgi:hypothetical protein
LAFPFIDQIESSGFQGSANRQVGCHGQRSLAFGELEAANRISTGTLTVENGGTMNVMRGAQTVFVAEPAGSTETVNIAADLAVRSHDVSARTGGVAGGLAGRLDASYREPKR